MYFYILDPRAVPSDRFEKQHTELQALLNEFGVAGESSRVTPLRTVSDLVETAAARGATTLVACGSDETFSQALAALHSRDMTLAFVPLVETSYLGTVLGIPDVATAVKNVAARRLERVDVAAVDGVQFMGYLEFGAMSQDLSAGGWLGGYRVLHQEPKEYQIRVDGSYTVSTRALGGLMINTRPTGSGERGIANPTDGYLDLLLLEHLSAFQIFRYRKDIVSGRLEKVPGATVIRCKRLEFQMPLNEPLTMFGKVVTKAPATVEILSQKLKLVVGKDRTF